MTEYEEDDLGEHIHEVLDIEVSLHLDEGADKMCVEIYNGVVDEITGESTDGRFNQRLRGDPPASVAVEMVEMMEKAYQAGIMDANIARSEIFGRSDDTDD